MENPITYFTILIILVFILLAMRTVVNTITMIIRVAFPLILITVVTVILLAWSGAWQFSRSTDPGPTGAQVEEQLDRPEREAPLPPGPSDESRYSRVNDETRQPAESNRSPAADTRPTGPRKTPTNFRWDDGGSPATDEVRYFENEDEVIIRIPKSKYREAVRERVTL